MGTHHSSQTAARRAALATEISGRNLDAILITDLINVRYLTGLASSNAAVLVWADGRALLATDGRYGTQAGEQAPDVDLLVERAVDAVLLAAAVDGGSTLIGFEEHNVTVASHHALTEAQPRAELIAAGQPVQQLRTVKDEAELALLARACEISTQALKQLWQGPFVGRTELEIARDLESRMFALGAHGLAFDTIVATGPNSAIPHHSPTERAVERGDFIKIDFGAQYGGYHADCTRTMMAGDVPAEWQREIHALVQQSQRAGKDALGVGVECVSIDTTCRDLIKDAGYGEYFTHGTGHGVGLEIHEAPSLGYTPEGTLADCVPVTVEPGIYLPGRGGVRIEDTLVVRASGTRNLTDITTDLLVVDA